MGLTEVIAEVKQDLVDPQSLSSNSVPLLFVDKVEIELAVRKDAETEPR